MTDKIRTMLRSKGLDAVFLKSRQNVGYASGFWGSFGALLITGRENYLFTDFRYQEYARTTVRGYQISICGGKLYDEVAKIAQRERLASVGYEEDGLTVAEFERLQKCLPGVSWVPISADMRSVRMVKTPQEIARVKTAEEICSRAFASLLTVIRPGMTEKQLENELAYRMKQEGADGFAFDSIVVSGSRSSLVHGTPSDKQVERGDFLLMDFGAVYENYCSDITRTVAVGEVSDFQREIYDIVKRAQQAALSSIRAGITGAEADKIARDIIASAGYGEAFGHSLGHGVGAEIHEDPVLSPRSETVLQDGMLVTVEPGIYLEGQFGVRIEDLVVVRQGGAENLTSAPKELIVV